jgi:hypothetical protein
MLYGVAPLDVASFATGAIVLVLTAVVACVVPMRRALAVDPFERFGRTRPAGHPERGEPGASS